MSWYVGSSRSTPSSRRTALQFLPRSWSRIAMLWTASAFAGLSRSASFTTVIASCGAPKA